jgi:hypothetical protein
MWLLEKVYEEGEMSPLRAGQLVHSDLGYHSANETCEFCQSNGAEILRKLVGYGLVEIESVVPNLGSE